MFRTIRVALLVLFSAALVCASVGLYIFWPVIRQTVHLTRQRFQPPVKVAVPPPQPPTITFKPPPGPPRKGNRPWKGIEAVFDDSRARRGEHMSWKDNPASVYTMVANPAFTDSDDFEAHCRELEKWHSELPDSPTALTALGRGYLDWAFDSEGWRTPNEIPNERWGLFVERVTKGREALQRAIQMGLPDGEAHRLMILVAMAEGWPEEEARAVLNEGSKLDPTYFPLYLQFARYLLPRWHGNPGDVERFASEVTELLPGDDGLEACARIAAGIHKSRVDRELIFFGEWDRKLLVKAADVWRQRKENDPEQLNFAALCAWTAQDVEAAAQLPRDMPELEENDWVWTWKQHFAEFKHWRRSIDEYAPTGESRWFWGSMFYGDQIIFADDSQSVWCGQGYDHFAIYNWNVEDGRMRWALPSLSEGLKSFAISERQGYAVAALKGSWFEGLRVWRLKDAKDPRHHVWRLSDVRRTEEHKLEGPCQAVAISSTEPLVAYATEGTIRLLNLRTKERGPTMEMRNYIRGLRFSPDGRLVMVRGEEKDQIWNVQTGELHVDLPNIKDQPRPDVICEEVIDIDEEGRIWAFAQQLKPKFMHNSTLVRYTPDAKTFEQMIPDMDMDLALPRTAILSPDRRLLAVGRAKDLTKGENVPQLLIEVWDVTTGQRLKRFGGHYSGLNAMSFSPDGKKLASMGGPTGLVKIWNTEP